MTKQTKPRAVKIPPRAAVNENGENLTGGEKMKNKMMLRDVRIYDNGGETLDRYTAVYMNLPEHNNQFSAVGMSENPFSPQGFGQHCTATVGRHLGKRIKFNDLPKDCQRLIQQDIDDVNKNSGGES